VKERMVSAAEKVCGRTKGRKRSKESWWWNEEVSDAVSEMKLLFRKSFRTKVPIYKRS